MGFPRRKEVSFLNGQTAISLLLIAFSLVVFMIFISLPPGVRGTPDWVLIFGFITFIIGVPLLFVGEYFNTPCHYCDGRVYNFQGHIVVEWIEPAKYSVKDFEMKKVMHSRCHLVAGEKRFKIPHPAHKDFYV